MARKTPDPEGSRPTRPGGTSPESQPASGNAKPKNTGEKERHGPFFKIMKLWRLLHDDRGRTTFTKEMLAQRYFPQDESDPDPEEVPYATGEEVDEQDLDFLEFPGGELDGLDDLYDVSGDDEPYGPGSAGDGTMSFARQPGRRPGELPEKPPRKRKKKPHRAGWPSEKQKQDVTRYLQALQNEGIAIWNVVNDGGIDRQLDDDEFEEWQQDHPSKERRWRYNPNGYWARELDTLLDQHRIQGYELVGILALQQLLAAMDGSPQHEATQQLIEKLKAHVPDAIYQDAEEKARAWRYSVANIRKYSTERAKQALAVWHRATIDQTQVIIKYRKPGKPVRQHRISAMGTLFDGEENSIYLLGGEAVQKDGELTGKWKPPVQWKLDRVLEVRQLPDENPAIADILPHDLVRAAPGEGPERLDISRLYSASAGAFLRYGEPTIRLELLVHHPSWIAWCLEKPFHPNQSHVLEKDENGRPQLRLVIGRCHEQEMCSRLLRLGGDITVVSPQSMIDKLRVAATKIGQRHRGSEHGGAKSC